MTQPGEDRLLNAVAELAREEHVQLMSQDLSDAAFAELSEAELQMLASAVAEQLTRQPLASPQQPLVQQSSLPERPPRVLPKASVARRLGWLAAAAAVFGGGVLWGGPRLAQYLRPGAQTVAESAPAAGDARRLVLPDGSTLALAAQTEARMLTLSPQEVRVQLDRGSVECEVAHNPERRFVVAVGALEVVVKGTHFTVSSGVQAAPQQVEVSVERGLVEVRQPPDRVLALLSAGQRWSSDGRNSPPPDPIARTEAGTSQPTTQEPVAQQPAISQPATPRPPASEAAPAAPSRPSAPAAARRRPAPSPRELFERADAERLAGHAQEAATAFDELRRQYPSDARAGYAAFMLGRIRLDSLADPAGAAEAFEFAIAHPGGGFFLEDAAARRVEALAKSGRADECQKAREQFLLEYPKAVRAPLVSKLCQPR